MSCALDAVSWTRMLSDRILFIDGEAIVIDKPAGLPVDAPRRGGEVIAARIDELKCGFKRPPTPMHRLDTDTSGCLLFARNAKARAPPSSRRSRRGTVEKYYLAVVAGEIAEEEGVIDVAARQDFERRGRVADGRAIRMALKRQRAGGGSLSATAPTLVEFRPLTGPHAPDPRARARGVRARDRRRPRLRRARAGRCCSTPRGWSCRASGKADDRRHRAAARPFRRVARCGLRTCRFPRTR